MGIIDYHQQLPFHITALVSEYHRLNRILNPADPKVRLDSATIGRLAEQCSKVEIDLRHWVLDTLEVPSGGELAERVERLRHMGGDENGAHLFQQYEIKASMLFNPAAQRPQPEHMFAG